MPENRQRSSYTGNFNYSSSGTSVGAEVFASSSAESRDSTISRVYSTKEPVTPTGGVHEAGIGVISSEA